MESFKKIKNINLLFLLKTGIGSALAILLADLLGLKFSPSAGIITLLTIQNTKKETIFVAIKRILAFLLAVCVSYFIFQWFGYTAMAFGIFVFLFVALCILLGLKDGISMNAVLMTHFLVEKRMDIHLIWNEIALLLIGMGIGIIINLIMPKNKERIRKEQHDLEEEIRVIIRGLANILRYKGVRKANSKFEPDINDFLMLEMKLERLLKKAYEEADNTLLTDTNYLVSYFEMRKLQIKVLIDILELINEIPIILPQSIPIADFLEHIAESFHELNNVEILLEEQKKLHDYFKKDKLPTSREEFEYRATLFQILKELEYFLHMKRNFILDLERNNMNSYWKF